MCRDAQRVRTTAAALASSRQSVWSSLTWLPNRRIWCCKSGFELRAYRLWANESRAASWHADIPPGFEGKRIPLPPIDSSLNFNLRLSISVCGSERDLRCWALTAVNGERERSERVSLLACSSITLDGLAVPWTCFAIIALSWTSFGLASNVPFISRDSCGLEASTGPEIFGRVKTWVKQTCYASLCSWCLCFSCGFILLRTLLPYNYMYTSFLLTMTDISLCCYCTEFQVC